MLKGSKITLPDGSVENIELLKLGDMVLTADGKEKPITDITAFISNLINIKISNSVPINLTKGQLIYCGKNNSLDSNDRRALANNKFKCDYIKSQHITNKTILFVPNINKVVASDITPNKARILGLYAAEGCLNKKTVVFSFGSHEKDNLVKFCKELIEEEYKCKCFVNISPSQPTKCSLYVTNKLLFDDCKLYVSSYSQHKKLNKKIVFGSNEVKLNFITGWLEGDGSVDKYSGKIIGTTASKNLAHQIRLMLNSLYISNSFYINKPSSSIINDRKITGNFDVYRIKISYNNATLFFNLSDKLKFVNKIKPRKPVSFIGNYRILPILKTCNIKEKHMLYKLTIQDNDSFICNGIVIR